MYLDGKENDTTTGKQKLERYDRAQRHRILVDAGTPQSSKESRKGTPDDDDDDTQQTKEENEELKAQVTSLTVQVELLTEEVESLTNDVETLKSDKSALQKEVQLLKDHPMSVGYIRDDDKRTKFYTGLTTFYLFQTLFNFVVPVVQMLQKMPGKLSLMDEFLIVLMKLRLGLLNEDLGYTGLASQILWYREYSINGWSVCIADSNHSLGGQTRKQFVKLCQLLSINITQMCGALLTALRCLYFIE